MSITLGLFFTVLLLAANAYFVAAEFAVTSSRRAQIEPLAAEGKRGGAQALYALQHVSLMLAISQLGITVMSTTLGAIAEPAIARLIEAPLELVGVPSTVVHAISFVFALLIVLFLHVVFGEMVPKNISIARSTQALLILAPSLVTLGRLLRPIVVFLDSAANWFIRLGGMEPKSEISAAYTIDEVATIVELSREEGKLEDDLGLLTGTLEFTDRNVRDLMVLRDNLTSLSHPVTPADVEAQVAATGFSRFPIENDKQEIDGYVHLKDVLYATDAQRNEPLPTWRIRPLETVLETLDAEEALRLMQRSAIHVVGVTGAKDGKLLGVLFLEDLLEELVGQVRDSLQRDQFQ